MARWRAMGGVLGPAAFITAWGVLGATADGYSPVDDPISRLAALGADTRPAMTAGLLAFAAGVGLLAGELRRSLPGPAWVAATVTAAGAVAIAVTPLDSSLGGTAHGVAAGTSYLALALVPLLAASDLRAAGHRGAAVASLAIGVTTAALLTTSVVVDADTGLWQRLGLTTGDLWLVTSGVLLLRPPRPAGVSRRVPRSAPGGRSWWPRSGGSSRS